MARLKMNYVLFCFLVVSLSILTRSQRLNGYIKLNGIKTEGKISNHDLKNSVNFAKDTVDRLHRLEKSLNWSNVKLRDDDLDYANFLENSPDSEALEEAEYSYISLIATNHLKHKYCRRLKLSNEDCLNHLSSHKLHETKLFPACSEKIRVCSNFENFAKYRNPNGACNHPYDAVRGRSRTSYKRIVKPTYLDGIDRIGNSVTKSKLPSARKISSTLFKNEGEVTRELTLNVMEWTEFTMHDLSHTVTRNMVHSRDKITCCDRDGSNLAPRYKHPFCFPIEVPEDDKFYSKFNRKCISYVRSLPSINNDCSFGSLEQLNQATHFLDGSQIYGSTRKTSDTLRSFKDGLLRFQMINNEVFLPYSTHEGYCLNSEHSRCFQGGDPRVNSQPLLTTLQTLFLREHNRVAGILKSLNPHWNDGLLYEESRRVVIAELQHITYQEWLPIILAKKLSDEGRDDFQEFMDPSVGNGFATAVMKFYHSLQGDDIKLYDEDRKVNITLKLKEVSRRFSPVKERFDQLLITLATQRIQKVGLYVPDDVRNHLHGTDVISLIIQRGRDHGMAGYVEYRELCGLEKVKSFEDLTPIIPLKTVKVLMQVYKDPRDIDLFVGGLSERRSNGGILGPTFSCIITDQFLRTKQGDRYFYTHVKQPKPFSNRQLKEIERIGLASIFCANGNVKKLQGNVFKTADKLNYMRNCSEIPQIDFEHWRDSVYMDAYGSEV